MDIRLLIDAIVRQTTVLIAQLATAGGSRAPLADVANQVFVNLARELHEAGISRKVSADMFGMALRTYRRRLQRLDESLTFRGQSLWQAVLGQLRTEVAVSQAAMLEAFSKDDPDIVRSILNDLSESGLVFKSGVGRSALFKAASLADGHSREVRAGLVEMIWTMVYRDGPVTLATLGSTLSLEDKDCEPALNALVEEGRVLAVTNEAGETTFHAANILITADAPAGWEAAIFDHYASVVQTVCAKLERISSRTSHDQVGGSTYTFDVWPGHPHEAEVMETLNGFRSRNTALRQKVQEWNGINPSPPSIVRVTCYLGQNHVDIPGLQAGGGEE